MKILIAPDKFKGSLSAAQVCDAISRGIRNILPTSIITNHPLADGGDGTLEVLCQHLDLTSCTVPTLDALGRPIEATYYTRNKTAYIELASASGIALLSQDLLNPLKTSTYGTGILLSHAISHGCTTINLFVGGSATHDVGLGIASALGFVFLDKESKSLPPIGESLAHVQKINYKGSHNLNLINIQILCDVENPAYGNKGAAHIFLPQKGANKEMIDTLELGTKHYCQKIYSRTGTKVCEIPGGGSAGGVAAGMVGLCGATIKSGIKEISKITQLEEEVSKADIVISGEGKLDSQSLDGKVLSGVAAYCQLYHKPLYLVVGKNDIDPTYTNTLGILEVYDLLSIATDVEDSIDNASKYIEMKAEELMVRLKKNSV